MDDLVEIIRQPILVFRQRTEALLRSLKFADFARNIGVFEGLKTGRRHDTPFGLRWSREWPLLNLGMLAASLGRRPERIDGIQNVPKVAGRTWVSLRCAVRKARRRSWDCDDPP